MNRKLYLLDMTTPEGEHAFCDGYEKRKAADVDAKIYREKGYKVKIVAYAKEVERCVSV